MKRTLALATMFLFLAAPLALGASSSQPLAPGDSITITCSTQLTGSFSGTSATLNCAPTAAPRYADSGADAHTDTSPDSDPDPASYGITDQPTPTPAPTATPSGAVAFVGDAETGDASQFCFVHSGVPWAS